MEPESVVEYREQSMIGSERAYEPIRESLQEYGRGVAGGLMFSLPLLYTMEVWWAGFLLDSTVLLICIGITFLLLLGYNRYGGIHPDVGMLDVVIDSIEEFGIGILLATLVLFLLGQITPEMPREEILGKIIIEAMLVSVGVSVGTAQLGVKPGESESQSERRKSEENDEESAPERPHILKQSVLGFCGAVLFAANIAPTEEVVIIAIESSAWKLLALALLSLSLGALILYFSAFHRSRRSFPPTGVLWGTLAVAATYALALLASALLLWFFGRFQGVSFSVAVSEVVVLGFAGNIGASAGRLLIE